MAFFRQPCARALVLLGLVLSSVAHAKAPVAPSWAPSVAAPADTTWPSPVGQYDIVPSAGVNTSRLTLWPNGHYDWYLTAPNGALENHGVWEHDAWQGQVRLTTNPLPGDVPFVLTGAASNDPLPFHEGDLHVRVGHFPNSGLESALPLMGARVTCEGLLRTMDAYTDAQGWASCTGVGVPLRRLTVRLNGLPNGTTFTTPRINARAWNVEFDVRAAQNALVFQGETWWQQDDGSLLWKPNALPTAPAWSYRPN